MAIANFSNYQLAVVSDNEINGRGRAERQMGGQAGICGFRFLGDGAVAFCLGVGEENAGRRWIIRDGGSRNATGFGGNLRKGAT
jgi:hypothetical protein